MTPRGWLFVLLTITWYNNNLSIDVTIDVTIDVIS